VNSGFRALVACAALAFATSASAEWSLRKSLDPITDEPKVSLFFVKNPDFLSLTCERSDVGYFTVAVGSTRTYLGGRPLVRKGTFRFDSDAPQEVSWGYSTNLGVLMDGKREFIERLAAADKLAVRLTTSNGGPADIVLSGLKGSTHIRSFLQACAEAGMR
jgi:hypothetical protein